MYTILLQVNIFISLLVWGLILGLIFDIYRFLFPSNKVKGILQYILDGVFWITITIVTFSVMIFTNLGEVTVYLIFAMVAGFLFYMLLLSKITFKVLIQIKKVILKISKIVYKIFRGIYMFFKRIVEIIIKLLLIVLLPFRWLVKLISKYILMLTKKIIRK